MSPDNRFEDFKFSVVVSAALVVIFVRNIVFKLAMYYVL